jgi:hypothetical protein
MDKLETMLLFDDLDKEIIIELMKINKEFKEQLQIKYEKAYKEAEKAIHFQL